METSKSEQGSVEFDFSNPNIAAVFPPYEDQKLFNSNQLVYDSDISEILDHDMENCKLDVLDDFDTSFCSDINRISLNDNHTFVNGSHDNTYKNTADSVKYVDCNTPGSRVRHSSELDSYPNSIRAQMRRVENDQYVDCNAASCSGVHRLSESDHYSHDIRVQMQRAEEDKCVDCNNEASCSGVHSYGLDRYANAIKVQMQKVEEEKYKLEKIMNATNSSGVCYMQHCPRSIGDINLYCNEEFQNQSFMSRSNGMNSVKLRRHSSLPNNASKNFINSQVNMLNKSNASTSSAQGKYNSMDYVEGIIYHMAKDPCGSRLLRRKFIAECSLNDFNTVFSEIINHVVELMTDPFASFLMHTLIELCSISQKSQIVHELTKEWGSLVEISCNGYGTGPIKKLIETLETDEQIYKIISALDIGIIYLMKNANGSRVLQSCLKHFMPEQNEFILDAALSHCVEIATHSHGCCFLQNCITSFNLCQRIRLITQILHYVLPLAEDCFGNYVVQCLLDLGIPWVNAAILTKLKGKYAHLLMKKHSSFVVEKCMKCVNEGQFAEIIQEIMESPLFLCVLEDEFGNFAIQRALERTKGALRASLMAAVEHYAPELKNHPYGKNVLHCIENGSSRSRSRSSIRYRNRC